MFKPFQYRAWCRRFDAKAGQLVDVGAVNDGDSAWLVMDRGMRDYHCANCRLFGINAEELNDADATKRSLALAAKAWLKNAIEGKTLFVESRGLDKYGRPLVVIWLREIEFGLPNYSVNAALLAHGLARPYMGELL